MKRLATGKVVVRRRFAYGSHYYDADNKLAQLLLSLMTRSDGSPRKAFVDKNLDVLREIGLEIVIKEPVYLEEAE